MLLKWDKEDNQAETVWIRRRHHHLLASCGLFKPSNLKKKPTGRTKTSEKLLGFGAVNTVFAAPPTVKSTYTSLMQKPTLIWKDHGRILILLGERRLQFACSVINGLLVKKKKAKKKRFCIQSTSLFKSADRNTVTNYDESINRLIRSQSTQTKH